MTIHFRPEKLASRFKQKLRAFIGALPSLMQEIRAARVARLQTKKEQAANRRRAMKRHQIGFTSLGVSIRNTTGNHGLPKPRRQQWL